MNRIIGVDYGSKRTGISITDSLQIIATPLKTVPTNSLIVHLDHLIDKYSVEIVVFGNPVNLNLLENQISSHLKGFITRFKQKYPNIQVVNIDERYTSKIAKQSILQSGLPKNKRKNKDLIDKISATIILQNYLDYNKL